MGKILFTPYVIIELLAIYSFISAYGFLAFLVEVVASGALGLYFILSAGSPSFRDGGVFGALGGKNLFETLGLGLCGFLLMMPGILTDVLGVIALIAALLFGRKIENAQNFTYQSAARNPRDYPNGDGEIIDVEAIDETKSVR